MNEENEEELEHYGTRGMHWGVRKAAGATSRKVADVTKKAAVASGKAAATGGKAGGRAVVKLHERRREQMRLNTKPSAGSRKVTAKDKSVFKASPKRLTDEQLQNRIKRMELEKKYNELNQRTSPKGKDFVGKVLSDSGRNVATTVLTAAGLYGVKKGLEGQMGKVKVAEMFPKKK